MFPPCSYQEHSNRFGGQVHSDKAYVMASFSHLCFSSPVFSYTPICWPFKPIMWRTIDLDQFAAACTSFARWMHNNFFALPGFYKFASIIAWRTLASDNLSCSTNFSCARVGLKLLYLVFSKFKACLSTSFTTGSGPLLFSSAVFRKAFARLLIDSAHWRRYAAVCSFLSLSKGAF